MPLRCASTASNEAAILMITTTTSYGRASNTVLLRAVGDGEPPAWEELISRYGRLVRSTVASFRLQEAEAEDAVQNTWLRLMERMDTIRDPRCLGGWLATTARRECLALIRRGHREAPDDALPELSSPTNVQAWEQRHEVLQSLDRLPPLQRQVMALTLDGYTPAEIASDLKITPEVIRSRLMRARRTLADAWLNAA